MEKERHCVSFAPSYPNFYTPVKLGSSRACACRAHTQQRWMPAGEASWSHFGSANGSSGGAESVLGSLTSGGSRLEQS